MVLSTVTPIHSGSRYPVILPEIPDSIITYTFKGEYKKHKNMQSVNYAKLLYRSFKQNIESYSELYCLINDSLDLQFKKESSGKNTLLMPTSGTDKIGAELLIYFQLVHITLSSKYCSSAMGGPLIASGGMGVPVVQPTMSVNSGYTTTIKLSTVISIFSVKEKRLLFTKKISSTKSGGDSDLYSRDVPTEQRQSVGSNEVENAVMDIARKLIKNTPWKIKDRRPQKEIVE
jgi:hypothetical protein